MHGQVPIAKLADPTEHFRSYADRLSGVLRDFDFAPVRLLADDLFRCWQEKRQVFFIGNGGSSGNAVHLVNDLIYPVSKSFGSGIRARALSENPATVTCLANDEGYENIYCYQLAVMADAGDILVAFSGSGNSPNIIKAIEEAKRLGMKSYAVLGYSGGKAKEMVDVPIHFPIDDMQIAEDVQTIVGHMVIQWLYRHRDRVAAQ